MKEKWKWIPTYEGLYKVSNFGRVLSVERTRKGNGNSVVRVPKLLIALPIGNDGYPEACIHKEGKRKTLPIHRLVLLAFVGSRPEGMECRHLDDNKLNNRLYNLCYGTHKENKKDAIRNGKVLKGNNHPNAKLTNQKIKKIRKLFKKGKSLADLGRMFNVTYQTISSIIKRKTWNHI
jgi:hypothetical protein